jgi:hypothetical protein
MRIIADTGADEMAIKKVILYFQNEQDALRFTLAAGSVMSEAEQDTGKQALHLINPLKGATRIRVGRTSSHEHEAASTAKAG